MKVLVAIEDEDDAYRIVRTIENRQWPDGTDFTLVHVVDTIPSPELEYRFEMLKEKLEAKSRAAFELLLGVSKQLKEMLPHAETHICVCCGNPTNEVLAAIEGAQPQVVVIGKHCRTRFEQQFHRSVSERILKRIPKSLDAVHVVEIPSESKSTRVQIG